MYRQKILKNGLTVITVPMSGTKTATILVMAGTGSKYEARELSGLSHFLEHMLFKGTSKRPSSMALVSELDSLGADYNAFTSKEYTGYWIKVNSKKLNRAADILADMYVDPKLEQEEIERESGVIVEEINMYQDNPMAYIEEVFEELLYGDTPAGRDTAGTKKTVMSFKRKDFDKYFNAQYGPENTIVVVAGNIEKEKVEKMVKSKFSKKQFNNRGEAFNNKVKASDDQTTSAISLKYKKTDQAHLVLGVRTPAFGSRDEAALKMLSIILGGSMSSRLFMNLRERNGLAYYVRCNFEAYTDTGYLAAQAGVPVAKIEDAIKIIMEEYKKIKNYKVLPDELKRNKDLIAGKTAIQLESSDSIANWYARKAVMAKSQDKKRKLVHKLDHNESLKKMLKVSSADIQRVSRKIFKQGKLNLAVIGPYKDKKKFKRLLKV